MVLDARELVDPAFFSRLESIQLRARSVVEGFLHGLHRSPYVGFSVEFSSHREYVPGDDPRHVNWKVFVWQRSSGLSGYRCWGPGGRERKQVHREQSRFGNDSCPRKGE